MAKDVSEVVLALEEAEAASNRAESAKNSATTDINRAELKINEVCLQLLKKRRNVLRWTSLGLIRAIAAVHSYLRQFHCNLPSV